MPVEWDGRLETRSSRSLDLELAYVSGWDKEDVHGRRFQDVVRRFGLGTFTDADVDSWRVPEFSKMIAFSVQAEMGWPKPDAPAEAPDKRQDRIVADEEKTYILESTRLSDENKATSEYLRDMIGG